MAKVDKEALEKSRKEFHAKQAQLAKEIAGIDKRRTDLAQQQQQLEVDYLQYTGEKIQKALTKEFVDLLAPVHTTVRCTDENLEGAYMDHGYARCARCFLLRQLNLGYLDEPFELEVRVVGSKRDG